MSIPNWPPPAVAVSYRVVCRGNDVYRVEQPRLLDFLPEHGDNRAELMGRVDHLLIALDALGVEASPTWVGYLVTDDEMSSHVTAWIAP